MKNIIITPFPNNKINDDAFQRDVENNSSGITEEQIKKQRKKKKREEIKVLIRKFDNGEKRLNYAIPVQVKNNNFLACFPNPIQLYLSQAIDHFNASEKIADEFNKHSLEMWEGQKFLTSLEGETNELYNQYLKLRISSIIAGTCAVEAFMNNMIPETFTITNEDGNTLNKDHIQRHTKFKDKLDIIIPEITNIDIKNNHHKTRNHLLQLSRVRNEFVHLKYSKSEGILDSYHSLFKDLTSIKIHELLKAIITYMNLNSPNYIRQ